MGMKFLNKKGWHTGSLRNIENVWKAEQKDEAEKRKLEELRKQIHEERERDEFRQLQEQAGFAPRQERLEFLYDSGLSVGKTSNEGFSALQSYPPAAHTSNSSSAPAEQSSTNFTPGALFEDKPQSANDSWRKLHSDPLLMIRQREQEALARIKNNPVKMAMIRKSLEAKKKDDEAHDEKQKKLKSKHKRHSSSKHQSDTEIDSDEDIERKRKANHKVKERVVSDDEDSGDRERRHTHSRKDHSGEKRCHDSPVNKRRDRKEDHAHLDVDKDSRDRRYGSPVNKRRDRNEGHEKLDIDRDLGDRRNASPVNKRRDRNEGHENLDIDRDSRDRRNGSPVNRRRDRNEGHEKLDIDRDLGDRRNASPVNKRRDRNEGRENSVIDRDSRDRRNGSPVNRRRDRNEGHSDMDRDSRDRRNGSPPNKRRDRNEGRENSDIDRASRDRGNGSPVNKRRDRNEGRENSDIDKDLRDRRNGSPVNKRRDRNEGPEQQLDTDMDSGERRKDYRHSRRDYGIPAKEKASKNEGRQHLDADKDLRDIRRTKDDYGSEKRDEKSSNEKYPADSRDDKPSSSAQTSDTKHAALPPKPESHRRRGKAPQLSEEERAARLREMQMDAEIHEESRWKRLKKAEEEDAQEASKATVSRGSSFLDDVQKSVYGAEKGGSSTIEESVRRRSHFSQGRTQVDEHNAFRR
ncbi:hypothetical protein KSS87_018989 [Heliosperma pusillum]|nr:hypothetical protein KSS87_018989 [Heliosperma pusillum]